MFGNMLNMSKITILLKPTEECNFRCQYCYHADTKYVKGRMTIEMFEDVIKKATASYQEIVLIFHGGEPLLMGYPFFEQAIAIINKYKTGHNTFSLGIQTNGYFLTEQFCELFQANGILPAISFDGPNELNSLRDKTAEITDKIINLRAKGYNLNLLGVITKNNIDYLDRCFEFARENGCNIKMNPVFPSGGAKAGDDYLVTADEYISALMKFIPKWMKYDETSNRVEPMFSLVSMAITKHGNGCTNCGCLSKWISIHHDGKMYPCGRSYTEEYCMGNISDIEELSDAFKHPNFIKLLKGAILRRSYCSDNCSYYPMCQGGCNNDALLNGDLTKPDGFTCAVYKSIIPFIQEYIENNRQDVQNRYVMDLLKCNTDGKYNDK